MRSAGLDETMGLESIAANVVQTSETVRNTEMCHRENRKLSFGTWKQNNIKKIHWSRDDDRAGVK